MEESVKLRIEVRNGSVEEVTRLIRAERSGTTLTSWLQACEDVARNIRCYCYFNCGKSPDLNGWDICAVFHGGTSR